MVLSILFVVTGVAVMVCLGNTILALEMLVGSLRDMEH